MIRLDWGARRKARKAVEANARFARLYRIFPSLDRIRWRRVESSVALAHYEIEKIMAEDSATKAAEKHLRQEAVESALETLFSARAHTASSRDRFYQDLMNEVNAAVAAAMGWTK